MLRFISLIVLLSLSFGALKSHAQLAPGGEVQTAKQLFETGTFYEKMEDWPKAIEHYERAAEEHFFVPAYSRLGRIYSDLASELKDPEKAEYWYMRGYTQSDPDAMIGLGHLWINGELSEVDFSFAKSLFSRAGDMGKSEAYTFIALAYDKGRGTNINKKLAEEWYRKGAKGGNSFSKGKLAEFVASFKGKNLPSEAPPPEAQSPAAQSSESQPSEALSRVPALKTANVQPVSNAIQKTAAVSNSEPTPSEGFGQWSIANYSTNRLRIGGGIRQDASSNGKTTTQGLSTNTSVQFWKQKCQKEGHKCVFLGECKIDEEMRVAQTADLTKGGYAFASCGADYLSAEKAAIGVCERKTDKPCSVFTLYSQ